MKKLPALLKLWNTPEFETELLQALKQLEVDQLPLKQAASFSGLFVQDSLQFSLLNQHESDQVLMLKLSVFYQEISNLCPCSGDEPETSEGHCEIQMTIDKSDGLIDFSIL
ncbi:MAG: hypothetical protein HKP55_09725 [Gammaproteobacteria bacterium]|nr:hypothetical protein [Gammaproteobacteria bacterium]